MTILPLACDSSSANNQDRVLTVEEQVKIRQIQKVETLNQILLSRLRLMEEQKISIILLDNKIEKPLLSYNSDKCLIAASLSKVITTGSLIHYLQKSAPDLEKSYSSLVKDIKNCPDLFYKGLYTTLTAINTYTVQTAYIANEYADDLLALLGCLNKNEKNFNKDSIKFGAEEVLGNIKKISCNSMVNGSGLTLYNIFTPDQIMQMLIYLQSFPEYRNTLMQPGKPGMLENRLKTLKAPAFLKTGSLKKSGVLCLAGYIKYVNQQIGPPLDKTMLDDNHWIIVVMMINGIPSDNFEDTMKWMDDTLVLFISSIEEG